MRKIITMAAIGFSSFFAKAQNPYYTTPYLITTNVSKPLTDGGLPFAVNLKQEKLGDTKTTELAAGFDPHRPGNCLAASVSFPAIKMPNFFARPQSYANVEIGAGLANYSIKEETQNIFGQALVATDVKKQAPYVYGMVSANYINNIALYKNDKVDITADIGGALGAGKLFGDVPPNTITYVGVGSYPGESTETGGIDMFLYNGIEATATKGDFSLKGGFGYRAISHTGAVGSLRLAYTF